MKLLDILNAVYEWAKPKQEYAWLNQPEHTSMQESFKEKLNDWFTKQKANPSVGQQQITPTASSAVQSFNYSKFNKNAVGLI